MKRRRVSLACVTCRKRKSKCDGSRPICSLCQELKLVCEYRGITAKEHEESGRLTRAQLEQRVKDLEEQIEIAEISSPHEPQHSTPFTGPCLKAPAASTEALSAKPSGAAIVEKASDDANPDEESNVDLLASRTFENEGESHVGYFGPSSNHAVFRLLSETFTGILNSAHLHRDIARPPSCNKEASPASPAFPQRPPALTQGHVDASDQLPPTMTIRLVDQYLSNVEPFMSIMSRPAVILLVTQHKRSAIQEALCNIVCALASAPSDHSTSRLYFERALNHLNISNLIGASITLIQTLLLVALYQQNHQLSIASWTYHGLAVKAAFQAGLQSVSMYRRIGEQERDMRLRLWYSLVNQDRMLSMCLGRPQMISPQYVRTPKLQFSLRTPPVYSLPSLEYHSRLTLLYEIVACTLHDVYHDNIDDEPVSARMLLASRSSIHWQLTSWREEAAKSFPILAQGDLVLTSSTISDSTRLRLILSIHFYRAVLLVNGPVILAVLRKTMCEELPDLLENIVPIVRHEFTTIRNLHYVLSTALSHPRGFLDQNAAWFLCNYTCFTLTLHVFALLLFCHRHAAFVASVGVSVSDTRELLDSSLQSMIVVRRSSVMTQRAHRCLSKFAQIFDAIDVNSQTLPHSTETSCEAAIDPSQYISATTSDFFDHEDLLNFFDDKATYWPWADL